MKRTLAPVQIVVHGDIPNQQVFERMAHSAFDSLPGGPWRLEVKPYKPLGKAIHRWQLQLIGPRSVGAGALVASDLAVRRRILNRLRELRPEKSTSQ
jgi:hypothetical protein